MKKIIFVISLIMVCTLSIYLYIDNDLIINKHNEKEEIISLEVNKNIGKITDYNIFGTHFNIVGNIELEDFNYDNYKLILKSIDDEIDILYSYTITDNIVNFKTGELLNEGIHLDSLKTDNYYLLFKNIEKNEYYTFINVSDYNNMTYYTVTQNKKNNKIEISFQKNIKNNLIDNGLNILVTSSKLPSTVYDIAIDPGHGGKDSGAIGVLNGVTYYEKDINLIIAKKIARNLEELGYKVLLTRETDLNIESYGNEGRAVIPNKYKTKLCLSIHNNSTGVYLNYGGVEIYVANDTNYTLAKNLADNIVIDANTNYSSKTSDKLIDGVYFMPFREYSIKEALEEWQARGYVSYELNSNIPYMFMIRELGGIKTHAYVDGRNATHGKNLYYNSNQTTEPYLIEFGYMIHAEDLNNLLINNELYANSVSKTINEYLSKR